MYKIYFNGVSMPNFLRVLKVDSSILSAPVNGKYEEKVITLTVTLVDRNKTVAEMSRELSMWLKGDNFALSPLSFSDDEDITYMAALKSTPVVEDLIFVGQTTIEFSVPSGTGFGQTKTISGTDTDELFIDNEGVAHTFPLIQVTPKNTNTAEVAFNIVDSVTGRVIRLKGPINEGEVITIDCNKKVVKRGSKVDMLLIQYNSDWLKFDRAVHVLSIDLPCEFSVSYTEKF